jgi:hypothetical protein
MPAEHIVEGEETAEGLHVHKGDSEIESEPPAAEQEPLD